MLITLNLFKTTKNYAAYKEEIDVDNGQALPEDATIYLSQETIKRTLEVDEVPHTLIGEFRVG